ncbi:hypothetical protein [Williamsia serinedens]|uniref:hypothetical protein n=1 Tax=Williamsia serinedens TaxID=391736 RepID=UPI0020A47CF3|nr:hypothetical protein [Williamsia serinedens]
MGALAGVGFCYAQPAHYSATSRVFIAAGSSSAVEAFQGAQAAQQSARTYASLAGGRGLLERAARRAQVDISPAALASELTINLPPLTTVIDVTVSDRNPSNAVALARGVSSELIDLVRELEAPPAGGVPAIRLVPVDTSSTAATRDSVLDLTVIGLAGLAGGVLGLLVALALDAISRRRSETGRRVARPARPAAETPQDDLPDNPVTGGRHGASSPESAPVWQVRT